MICEADNITYSFVGLELVWLHLNHFVEIPELAEERIKGWSNTDSIAKLVACAQSLWFLINCLGRVIQQLPFSTLEIFTVSFIGCTWINYYFWWHKPQGLETITFIHVPHLLEPTLDAMEEAVQLGRRGEWRIVARSSLSNIGDNFRRKGTAIEQATRRSLAVIELTGMNNLPLGLDRDLLEWEDLMNDALLGYWGESWQLACATFPGILNSAFDIVAWNFVFPTPIESLLWKISTCTSTGLALVTMVYTLVDWAVANKKDRQMLESISFKFYAMVYSILRLYVIVEMFIGLRALPEGVFRTVAWSKYFPHIF